MSPSASVELVRVTKRFGATLAVHDLSLTVFTGEFFALLGPSGCGKTTMLRLIGGLETPDSGDIRIAGEAVNDQPPYVRRSNIVFQHYALFPHLTVQDNVAFGLRVKSQRLPAAEVAKRVNAVLELVQLAGFETRRPHQLSGGQQQRVALARALVLQPHVLLLDEPLGALDRQLRKAMQTELRRIQREVGMTFLYVTHDQDEALSMADRIAVMRHGNIEQLGTPQDIFQAPRTKFVAEFMGAANILTGKISANAGHTVCIETPTGLRVLCQCVPAMSVGQSVSFVVRPDVVQIVPHDWTWTGDNTFSGTVTSKTYLGEVTEITVALPGGDTILCRTPSRLEQQFGYQEAAAVLVGWQAHDSHVLQE